MPIPRRNEDIEGHRLLGEWFKLMMQKQNATFHDLVTEAREDGFAAAYIGNRADLQGKTGRAWYSQIHGAWLFAVRKAETLYQVYRNCPVTAIRKRPKAARALAKTATGGAS